MDKDKAQLVLIAADKKRQRLLDVAKVRYANECLKIQRGYEREIMRVAALVRGNIKAND